MEKLYAIYHKLELRPPKGFITDVVSLSRVAEHLGQNYQDFENKSSSKSGQFKTVETCQRLIDFEFTNSAEHGKTLNRVEIHGEAFELMPLDIGQILTGMESEGFVITEAHSRILLPPTFISWPTIDQYFKAEAYTSGCKIVSPLTDPSNGYAKTWQAGKRPKTRSAHTQGKRLTFYQADKIHPELPEGTTTMELQLFGDTAHKFVFSDMTRAVDLTLRTIGVIRGYFEFKVLEGDSNKTRRPTADFWKKVVGDLAAIHLPRLIKAEAKTDTRAQKCREMLYGRLLTLKADLFVKTIAEFVLELGLSDKLAQELTPVF